MDELLTYLSDDTSVDYWYDDAILICIEILESFSDKEWIDLMTALPSLNESASVKLAESLGEIKNKNALACFKCLLKSDSVSVCFACIDALRSYKDLLVDEAFVNVALDTAKSIVSVVSPMKSLIVKDFIRIFS